VLQRKIILFLCYVIFFFYTKRQKYFDMIRLISFFLLLFCSIGAYPQNFKLGFQASPHLTWMSSSRGDIVNKEYKPGIKYGLEADLYIAGYPRYAINTGLFVSNYSFSASYVTDTSFFIGTNTFDDEVDLTFKLNYIEIPLNIKLRSDQFYRMTFFGQFGLSNLFNISATARSSDFQFGGDQVNHGMNNRTIAFYNLCMIMGGGIEYDLGGNTSVTAGIQYSNGLTDVTKIRNLNEKTIFNSVRLLIGVMF
jgi:hypothetical protein